MRAVWPERLPLTMRLGCDDFNPHRVTLDLADLSIRFNTDEMWSKPFAELALYSWRDWQCEHPGAALNLERGPCFDRSFMASSGSDCLAARRAGLQ